ncbi:TetR/AcrR family transcriptional regulator [Pseudofrankia sp. DC12]|uniref:TetR/AcrR family transcriptional regulator n=1 Tax=Pseudofrankia sp. DC12 TaxID=683315 RepID=UPI001E2D017D|nr:TetR/AcrR family transcriptional regulator [Pseudofrankia sp. DC12]
MATEIVGERGFAATSIDDIVKAAGASRATLYAHFDSKDAILREIVQRMWGDVEEQYVAFGQLPDWSREQIRQWLQGFALAHRRDIRRNLAAVEAWVHALVGEAQEQYTRQIAHVRSNRELWSHLDTQTADARASMLVSMLQGEFARYSLNRLDTINDRDLEAFIDRLTDGVRDLLAVPDDQPARPDRGPTPD